MSFDTTWDVNKYRYHYELPHHWELKKKFILCHKERFPEDRLICLAQIFCNVHYLGCRYGDDIMELIDELTRGLTERNEKFDSKSFSLASDAVEAKVKAFTGQTGQNQQSNQVKTVRRTMEPMSFMPASDSGNPGGSRPGVTDLAEILTSRKRPTDSSLNGSDPKSSKFYYDDSPNQQYNQQNQQQFRRPNQQFNQQFNRQQGQQYSQQHNKPYETQENQQFNQSYNQQQNQQYGQQQNQRYGQQQNQQYNQQQNQQYGQQQNQQYGQQQNQQYNQQQNRQPQNKQNQSQNQNKMYSFENRRAMALVKEVVESGPFGKVVVFKNAHKDDGVINIIERAANAAHMNMSFTFNPSKDSSINCKFCLDGMYVADGVGMSKKLAKEAACRLALERLRETSFTIEVKEHFIGCGTTVGRDLESGFKGAAEIPLAENNIGSKMLKMMGWTGGGLGKEEQGIEEPIKAYDQKIKRGGLGIENFSDFRKKVTRIIEEYARSDEKNDLVFSPDFTKDERKTIHELVRKYNLKSRSYGKQEDTRHIVVFRKISPLEIVEDLLICGGETQKYKLISPEPKM